MSDLHANRASDTCIHQPHGLCESCEEQRASDPIAWEEYGHHEAGERRWAEELRRIEEERRSVASNDVSDLPW